MRRAPLLALPVIALTVAVPLAAAHPPPPPPEELAIDGPGRPLVEWSTWVRVAFGWAPEPDAGRPRIIGPGSGTGAGPAYDSGWESGLGAELSLPLTHGGNLRLGPWVEARTSSAPVLGGELVLAARPAKLDMFWYEGEGIWMLRAGGNRDLVTGAIAWGYRAPWDLFHPPSGRSRYTIGVRVVATATRAVDDPGRWSATIGLETEPLGALRYLLGIKAWYR
ncbi:MAG TPA: hypothetical protein VHE35_36330 [Kofleriaceae bacterium]|nr:hypothetical protein [Kofleriaceae bacterium]